MHLGLATSLALHAALLVWALLTIHATPPFKLPEPTPVEVSIISADDLVRLRQGDRNSKNLDADGRDGSARQPPIKEVKTPPPPPPPPPKAAEPSPPPAPEVTAEPPPEPPKPKEDEIAKALAALQAAPMKPPEPAVVPGPTPDERQKLEDAIQEAERKAAEEAKRKADAEAKAKADAALRKKLADDKKKRDDLARKLAEDKKKKDDAQKNALTSLEDKLKNLPDDATPKALASQQPVKAATAVGPKSDTPTKTKGPAAGAPEGRDKQLTANQASMLGTLMKQQVSRCWNINSGLEGIDKIVVQVEIKLSADGRLAQPPRVLNGQSSPIFTDAANGAVRALVQCEPYDLPKDLYQGGWDFMVVTFDPKRMF